jgi:NAD+ synthase (glutamine-hydrolysing)
MNLIRLGLGSLDTTVGAFNSNSCGIENAMREMTSRNCTIGVFNECTIGGYPGEDFTSWKGFVDGQFEKLQELARKTGENGFVGPIFSVGLLVAYRGNVYNCVALIGRGKIFGIVPKMKLPTYSIFYEDRTISRWIAGRSIINSEGIPFGDLVFRFPFGLAAAEICEDSWTTDGPMKHHSYNGASLILNSSASPSRTGVLNTRLEMLATRSSDYQVAIAYANQFGAQDSLVFDGCGFVFQAGRLMKSTDRWREGVNTQVIDLDEIERARRENTTWRTDQRLYFEEEIVSREVEVDFDKVLGTSYVCGVDMKDFPAVSDNPFLPKKSPQKPAWHDEYFEELIMPMIVGVDGYLKKTGVFKGVVIALSGGKDSVLTLLVAILRLQWKYGDKWRDHAEAGEIVCVSMPTKFNSDNTKDISRNLCESFGIKLIEESIEETFKARVAQVERMIGRKLDKNNREDRILLQCMQARIRGSLMWDISAALGLLWLQTGNMSEKAVGYTTVGGDLMGGYSLISNLPKTVIVVLIEYLKGKILETFSMFLRDQFLSAMVDLLESSASAELDENQTDEADLMPYRVLDNCIHYFVAEKKMPTEVYLILRSVFSDEKLLALDPKYTRGDLKVWVKKFFKLFFSSIFKWVQSPQGVHLGKIELDRERALQLQVLVSREWLKLDEIDALPD